MDAEMITAEVPDRMKEARRWLLWKAEPQPGGKKPRKVPYYVDGRKRLGKLDGEADWSRLATFDAALAAFQSGGYTGMGFALGPDGEGGSWQGIDLDSISGNGQLLALKDQLPGYVETSPSGNGVHAIGYGEAFRSIGSNATGIEAYSGGRYFTMTGDALGGDIEDLSGFVNGTLWPLRQAEHPKAAPKAKDSTTAPDAVTIADLRSALFHLRSDERDIWVRMGMALKGLGDIGRGLWLDWSATSEKFDPADAARVWDSFKSDGITFKSVFAEAQQSGWTNPRSNVVKITHAKKEADTEPKVVREPRGDWSDRLIVKMRDDGTSKILCRVHNLILILENSPDWKGRIELNEFSGRISVDRADIDDVGPIVVKAEMEREWIPEKVPTGDILDAMSVVASRCTYHPVREYLQGLKWDGVERISHFFEDFCGCPRDEYHMAVAQSLFVSAAARILKPGCKVDTMVILESAQGMGKTKLWMSLFGEWCVEVTASLSDKDFYAGLRGVWAADFSELDAFSRAETTQIKRIMTSQSDSYRPHYGRSVQTFPRQCIFVGGTNRDDWNSDPTGARRFFPIKVAQRINTDAVAEIRDQLWGEAVQLFERGATWWDVPDAQARQDATYHGDPWEDPIAAYLLGRSNVTVTDVLGSCLGIETGRQTRGDQMRVASVLKRIGWTRKRIKTGWAYLAP